MGVPRPLRPKPSPPKQKSWTAGDIARAIRENIHNPANLHRLADALGGDHRSGQNQERPKALRDEASMDS